MEIVKLEPATKDYIWGGNKLRNWGKISADDRIAECWELSLHKDGLCKIASGKDKGKFLADALKPSDIGVRAKEFEFFPVLTKLIDANDNLSVQVHPSDHYALKNEGQFGKTEMWYVADCDEGGGIYCGFKKAISKDEYVERIKQNTLMEVLQFYNVKKGDSFFIEAGTVHAIAKGVTIIEVQQNSNLTYRVFDYNRLDKSGQPRPLHIDKAVTVSNLDKSKGAIVKKKLSDSISELCKCKYFSVYECSNDGVGEVEAAESFASFTVIEGSGKIGDLSFTKGDTIFIPANYGKVKIEGSLKYLLTKI